MCPSRGAPRFRAAAAPYRRSSAARHRNLQDRLQRPPAAPLHVLHRTPVGRGPLSEPCTETRSRWVPGGIVSDGRRGITHTTCASARSPVDPGRQLDDADDQPCGRPRRWVSPEGQSRGVQARNRLRRARAMTGLRMRRDRDPRRNRLSRLDAVSESTRDEAKRCRAQGVWVATRRGPLQAPSRVARPRPARAR